MHGSFFVQLQHYVEETYGEKTWEELYRQADIKKERTYYLLRAYSNHDFSVLLEDLSGITGLSTTAICNDFGRYFSRYLLNSYSIMIKSSWRTLDIIQQFHHCFKLLTKLEESGFTPTDLMIERVGPYEIKACYKNKIRCCELFVGIVHGFADHFHEAITVEHPKCMLNGSEECEIIISKIPAKQLLMKLKEESAVKKVNTEEKKNH